MHPANPIQTRTPRIPLRLVLIGTLVSAVMHGLVASTFLHCLTLLLANKKRADTDRARRWFLVAYIVTMFLLSAVATIQAFVYIVKAVVGELKPTSFTPLRTNAPITLPLAIWGADGVMLWRCVVLFASESYFNRMILNLILFIAGCLSVGSGILYYSASNIPIFISKHSPPLLPTAITICISAINNLILTSLIAGRLWFHQKSMRRKLGSEYGSPYRRIIIICVESCILLLINSLAFVVLFAMEDGVIKTAIIPELLLPHICVLSPMLIVYRVARGRALTTHPVLNGAPNSTGDHNSGQSIFSSPIQFRHSASDGTRTRDTLASALMHSLSIIMGRHDEGHENERDSLDMAECAK